MALVGGAAGPAGFVSPAVDRASLPPKAGLSKRIGLVKLTT